MPSPAWYDADTDDADRHRTRDAIARLEGRGCCDDVRAENERLREVVARVEALADDAEVWHNVRVDARHIAENLRAALAGTAPVAPARHDDTQDGAR